MKSAENSKQDSNNIDRDYQPKLKQTSKILDNDSVSCKRSNLSITSKRSTHSISSKRSNDSVSSKRSNVSSNHANDSITNKRSNDSLSSKRSNDSVSRKRSNDSNTSDKSQHLVDQIPVQLVESVLCDQHIKPVANSKQDSVVSNCDKSLNKTNSNPVSVTQDEQLNVLDWLDEPVNELNISKQNSIFKDGSITSKPPSFSVIEVSKKNSKQDLSSMSEDLPFKSDKLSIKSAESISFDGKFERRIKTSFKDIRR